MDYGSLKLHLSSIFEKADSAAFIEPLLVLRSGVLIIISDYRKKHDDIIICRISKLEIDSGCFGVRWEGNTQAAMKAIEEFINAKSTKNPNK